jgi:putative Mn2+ efflux pump MntP
MVFAVSILIIIALSFQVFPVALGISSKDSFKSVAIYLLVLSVTQTAFFLLGFYAGEQFMHLLDGYKSTILFAGFFLIGIRMIIEVLRIRKGERTYILVDKNSTVFAAMAQSINTFLAALLLNFIPVDKLYLAMILFISSTMIGVVGIKLKAERLSFSFASLLYLMGGVSIIVSSLYFIFAAL